MTIEQIEEDLAAIPMKGFGWHKWCLYVAHAFLWLGFWAAVYRAWSGSDLLLMSYSLMMLGIGLLVFRGVAFFMNVWTVWAAYISMREIQRADPNLLPSSEAPGE